ncbi:MAG TPA: cadherin repeat domain-containing protein, partial [Phycisphaerae bacterium]|nr:cadherin repeat domain-containing protein [Phycisphaerae bacterium]
NLTVRVTDTGSLTNTATVTINLSNVNETPVVNDQVFSVNENSPNGTVVGTVAAGDVDAGDSLTYAITAGNTDNAFAINSSTGQITVNNAGALDYETNPTFNLTVEVTDSGGLTGTAAVTVNLDDVNEPPAVSEEFFNAGKDSADTSDTGSRALRPMVSLFTVDAIALELPGPAAAASPRLDDLSSLFLVFPGDMPPDSPTPSSPGVPESQAQDVSEPTASDVPQPAEPGADEPKAPVAAGQVAGDNAHQAPYKGNLDRRSRADDSPGDEPTVAGRPMSQDLASTAEQISRAARRQENREKMKVDAALVTAASALAGYIAWLLRGGAQLGRLLSAGPLRNVFGSLGLPGLSGMQHRKLQVRERKGRDDKA